MHLSNSDVLRLIGRIEDLTDLDFLRNQNTIREAISSSKILIVGAAGSIGRAVCREILKLEPLKLSLVDISENGLVELTRDIRSSDISSQTELSIYPLDYTSTQFEQYLNSVPAYDYVLNFAALKHVRSEKDPWTLLRMIDVNVLSAIKLAQYCALHKVKKYFVVSTDKSVNPANIMGASKLMMEEALYNTIPNLSYSSARFANVAFSDGSLLNGFQYRLQKKQPLSAPIDVKRYFITEEEAAKICLISCFCCNNREIVVPKLSDDLKLTNFVEIAKNFLDFHNFEPVVLSSEQQARAYFSSNEFGSQWPCYFFNSSTTGEKGYEEFTSSDEFVVSDRYAKLEVVAFMPKLSVLETKQFLSEVSSFFTQENIARENIVSLFKVTLRSLNHVDTGEYLQDKM